MLQGNKKITKKKIPQANNKILIRACFLIQPVFFKEIPTTNYKLLVCTGTGARNSSLFKQPARAIVRTCWTHKNVD